MYSDKVMEIFKTETGDSPKNAGILKNADASGQVGNARCGDIMKIYLKISDGVIIDAKFKTFGCVSAIASTSIACDMIKGKTIEEALSFENSDFVKALGGLPAVKIHCSVLAKEALEAAVADYRKKQAKLAGG
ncbi:MAG: iron-sulfur cluster assembly scaffold protein [Christensenellaceae bacterium]|jgi:nitrogen fixation NifU-like protein|nr:iron-sulfur cluster assembly scaffold protein [Christensenellaceae bacterium]